MDKLKKYIPFILIFMTRNNIVQACGGQLTSANGVIESPNFPGIYPNDVQCTWVIEVVAGHVIRLEFESFEVEAHCECIFDAVVVYDGTQDDEIGRYCDQNPLKVITSTSNRVTVSFTTDFSRQGTGFRATYESRAVLSECIILGDPRGTPQFLNYRSKYALTIFTTMTVLQPGYVTRFDYVGLNFTESASEYAYISFWYPVGANRYSLRGKIRFEVLEDFNEQEVDSADQIAVQSGDMVGVHYPDTGAGSLFYEAGHSYVSYLYGGLASPVLHVADGSTQADPQGAPWQPGHEIVVVPSDSGQPMSVALRIFTTCDCDNQCVSGCSPRCKYDRCNVNNAHCSEGCKPGYHGDRCEQECAPGLHGENCALPCGQCADGAVCDRETGNCPLGCQFQAKPPLCKEPKYSDEEEAEDLWFWLTIGLGAACVVLLLLVIILAAMCSRSNRKLKKEKRINRANQSSPMTSGMYGPQMPVSPPVSSLNMHDVNALNMMTMQDPRVLNTTPTMPEPSIASGHTYEPLNTRKKSSERYVFDWKHRRR